MGLLQKLKKVLTPVGPEFNEGKLTGREYAKKDAQKFETAVHRPSSASGSLKSRSYTNQLREQGKSDEFIKGFHFGYRERYEELISVYFGT